MKVTQRKNKNRTRSIEKQMYTSGKQQKCVKQITDNKKGLVFTSPFNMQFIVNYLFTLNAAIPG